MPRSQLPPLQQLLIWLRFAWRLICQRPMIFVAIGLLAPITTSLALAWLPWPEQTSPAVWLYVLANAVVYGLPLLLSVHLACVMARSVNRQQAIPTQPWLLWSMVRVIFKPTLGMWLLLMQVYLAGFIVRDVLLPHHHASGEQFGVTATILGSEALMVGTYCLAWFISFSLMVSPLQLFYELHWVAAWRKSFQTMQSYLWLPVVTGFLGMVLVGISFIPWLALPLQILALPLPVLLGVLQYVIWLDLYQGNREPQRLEIAAQSSKPAPPQPSVEG